MLLCAAVVFASCSKDDPTPEPTDIAVAFSSLTANGDANTTTTVLTLTFDKAIEGLAADDITLTAGETGAAKGALTDKTGGVYELAVSDITKTGEVTVAVAKTGYTITPASKKVEVKLAAVNKTYITVAELRAKGETNITDDVYVKANVISNKEGGNSISLKNVVISDGAAGINILFTADADYAVGTELELKLKGATLAKYEGLLQLQNFPNDNAVTTGQTTIIPAKSITAEDLMTGNFESMYVAVADVEVMVDDLGKTMVIDGEHTNIGIEAKTGEEFSMFSASNSTFAATDVPQGSGTLKGIARISIPAGGIAIIQIAPQTTSDFEVLTDTRFGASPKFVTLNGIKVATGNLVADGANGAKIGQSTDNGLYFQFGSLIGWSGAGDPTIRIKPANFDATDDKDAWSSTGKIWQGTTGTVPFTVAGSDDEKAGIGDPCRYYLGDTWRLPTSAEFNILIPSYSNGWSWDDEEQSASHTSGLKIPASGFRNYDDGSLSNVGSNGYYWSASPLDSDFGYSLYFDSSNVTPGIDILRANGLAVRCVRD